MENSYKCIVTKTAQRNTNITPKEVQNGAGMDYIGQLTLFQDSSNVPNLPFALQSTYLEHHQVPHVLVQGDNFTLCQAKKTSFKKTSFSYIVTIDEAHKVYDHLPSYCPAFDAMKQFRFALPSFCNVSNFNRCSDTNFERRVFNLRSDKCIVLRNGI